MVVDLSDPDIPLLSDEFVLPVLKIVKNTGNLFSTAHINNISELSDNVTMIIICGTAMADLWYTGIKCIRALFEFKKPVLGICAGMQLLLKSDGGDTIPSLEIGMTDVKINPAGMTDPLTSGIEVISVYSLHQYSCIVPESWIILGVSKTGPQIVKSRIFPRYGLLFHPEVRNEWLIERFVKIYTN